MNALVISTNQNRHPAPVIPYGACLAAEAAQQAGHQVRLLDLMFVQESLPAVVAALREFPPDVVGLSVRNLDNNNMQAPVEFVSGLTAITRAIRELTSAPIVLGGPAVGVMPEPLLRATQAHSAVLGDGEVVFPALLKALAHHNVLSQVPRLAWLENGQMRVSSSRPCSLQNSAIAPQFERWLDCKKYQANLATTPLQSKRGCPYTCIYCTYGISEGRDYRLFPPDDVAQAVRRLSARGYRDIEFVDNVFNSPYDHALAVCEALARHSHRSRLTTIELNPAFVDDRLLRAMARAGFVGVGLTAESAADAVLDGLQKGYTRREVEGAAEAIRRSRLPCFWLFLMGGPGETEDTVRQTLDFVRRVLRRGDVAFINVGIRIYPDTELERRAREEGVTLATRQEMLTPVFYFSPNLDADWTWRQVRGAAAENLNLLHGASLSHPWLPAINRLFSRLPAPRPLWRHTRTLRWVFRALGQDI